MQYALNQSQCQAKDIQFIDVNGSGSEVTDLLEIKAITAIYREDISVPCYLGSMKPNIGHPLCAEGIASFIKVCLMLYYQSLVPFLSGQQPLNHFPLEAKNFVFPREARNMDLSYAALNSFADGGTNAHVILKHYKSTAKTSSRRPLAIPPMNLVDIRNLNLEAEVGL